MLHHSDANEVVWRPQHQHLHSSSSHPNSNSNSNTNLHTNSANSMHSPQHHPALAFMQQTHQSQSHQHQQHHARGISNPQLQNSPFSQQQLHQHPPHHQPAASPPNQQQQQSWNSAHQSVNNTYSHMRTNSSSVNAPMSHFSSAMSPSTTPGPSSRLLNPNNNNGGALNAGNGLSNASANNNINQNHSIDYNSNIRSSSAFYSASPSPPPTLNSNFLNGSNSSNALLHNLANANNSPSPSPSPSPDPFHSRANDPARIQALIQVIQQLHDSGVQHKFMSQLGIIFKQLHPTLFVKGILKELVDNACNAGLLVLSGPAGQQQVELTPAGASIAKAWRQNHQEQNQQQLHEMKETLQQYALQQQQQQQQQSNQGGWNNYNSSSNMKAASSGASFAFLDDGEFNPRMNQSSLNTTNISNAESSTNNSGGNSLNNTGHSGIGGFSNMNSLNNTGGSHLDAELSAINTTSGNFTSHPKDSARIDLNNLFGPTSTTLFGGSGGNHDADHDAEEDSELLHSYQEQELAMDRLRAEKEQQQLQLNNNSVQLHDNAGYNSSSGPPSRPSSQQSFYTPANAAQQQHIINGSNIHAFLAGTPNLPTNTPATINAATLNNDLSNTPTDPNALQLLPPLPTSLEEKTFRGERLKHLKYIFHFRVHPCLNYLQKGSCPYDNKNECFNYHTLKTRRRIPRIYQFSNGIFWSYNACRCQAIEKEQKCEKGEGCRYAHCKEEIAYHPSRYKSAQCSYPLRADGTCSRFGAHCAFSHGENDVRRPIVLKQGMPHKLCLASHTLVLPMDGNVVRADKVVTGQMLRGQNGPVRVASVEPVVGYRALFTIDTQTGSYTVTPDHQVTLRWMQPTRVTVRRTSQLNQNQCIMVFSWHDRYRLLLEDDSGYSQQAWIVNLPEGSSVVDADDEEHVWAETDKLLNQVSFPSIAAAREWAQQQWEAINIGASAMQVGEVFETSAKNLVANWDAWKVSEKRHSYVSGVSVRVPQPLRICPTTASDVVNSDAPVSVSQSVLDNFESAAVETENVGRADGVSNPRVLRFLLKAVDDGVDGIPRFRNAVAGDTARIAYQMLYPLEHNELASMPTSDMAFSFLQLQRVHKALGVQEESAELVINEVNPLVHQKQSVNGEIPNEQPVNGLSQSFDKLCESSCEALLQTGASSIVAFGSRTEEAWMKRMGWVENVTSDATGVCVREIRVQGRTVRIYFAPHPSSWRDYNALVGTLAAAHEIDVNPDALQGTVAALLKDNASELVVDPLVAFHPLPGPTMRDVAVTDYNVTNIEIEPQFDELLQEKQDSRRYALAGGQLTHNCEPSLAVLQEQQQRVAALTGLTLAELNGFSVSGHNNSMSFGNNSNVSSASNSLNNTQQSGNMSNFSNSNSQQLQLQNPHVQLNPNSNSGSLNNTSGNIVGSHPALLAWEQQQQQQQQSHHTQLPMGSNADLSSGLNFDRFNQNFVPNSPQQQQRTSMANPTGLGLPSTAASNSGMNTSTMQNLSLNPNDLSYGTAPNSPSSAGTLSTANVDLTTLDSKQFMTPLDEMLSDREFYLYSYKTQPCRNQTISCAKGECASFHYETKRRRNPRVFRYSQEPCANVKPIDGSVVSSGANGWRRPSSCRNGDACEYAHTLLETLYHPAVYKMTMCEHFSEHDRSTWQNCKWKRACSHAHSRAELEYAETAARNEINNTSRSIASNHSDLSSIAPAGGFFDPASHLTSGGSFDTPNNSVNQTGASDFSRGASTSVDSHNPLSQTAPPSVDVQSDQSMRNVLLKQDAAARILRMQQQQLQPNTAPLHANLNSTTSSSLTSTNNSSVQPQSLTAAVNMIETLKSENSHLLDRLSRYEKEWSGVKTKLSEKDSLIKQLQWNFDLQKEELLAMKAQMQQLEILKRSVMQLQQQPQGNGSNPSSQTPTSTIRSSTPVNSDASLSASPTSGNATSPSHAATSQAVATHDLHSGHTAAAEMAEHLLGTASS